MAGRVILDDVAQRAFASDSKIGILATRGAEGKAHVSLITTLQGATEGRLSWGQFCEGASKANVRRDPRAGFLVMNLDKNFWRGTARWTGEVREGQDFDAYNRKPLFRYNAYFGIHTVHYMDLESIGPMEGLSMPRIIAGSLAAQGARPVARRWGARDGLRPWALGLINAMDSLKFLSWVDRDGFPRIAPVVPVAAADPGRLVLCASVFSGELAAIPEGSDVAVFTMNLKMESVLAGGRFGGWLGVAGLGAALGIIELDRVYNSMPPRQGLIWPRAPLAPVREFQAGPVP